MWEGGVQEGRRWWKLGVQEAEAYHAARSAAPPA